MGSDSMPLAPGVPFPPSLHFLAIHRMGRLSPHEAESRMFGDSPLGPIGKTHFMHSGDAHALLQLSLT